MIRPDIGKIYQSATMFIIGGLVGKAAAKLAINNDNVLCNS